MLANVQQKTVSHHRSRRRQGRVDPYRRIRHLRPTARMGYEHKTVCHGLAICARRDGDGFHEIHVNTMEGFGRAAFMAATASRRRQEKLPLYLAFFQFVHNARKRGKALLTALVEAIVAHHPNRDEPRTRSPPMAKRGYDRARRMISAPPRPISSAPSAPKKAKAPRSSCRLQHFAMNLLLPRSPRRRADAHAALLADRAGGT